MTTTSLGFIVSIFSVQEEINRQFNWQIVIDSARIEVSGNEQCDAAALFNLASYVIENTSLLFAALLLFSLFPSSVIQKQGSKFVV